MKVDKRTKQMPIVVTEPELESIKDHLHRLNKLRRHQGERPYSFSGYALEALEARMEADQASLTQQEKAAARVTEATAEDIADRARRINRDRANG